MDRSSTDRAVQDAIVLSIIQRAYCAEHGANIKHVEVQFNGGSPRLAKPMLKNIKKLTPLKEFVPKQFKGILHIDIFGYSADLKLTSK